MKTETRAIIDAYNNGESMNAIARTFGTYASTIKRILEQNNVELRHDSKAKGNLYVKDGEKLIAWAKAQGRLVTKTELAEVIGRKRLSPSYFIKYPELGQYIEPYGQEELQGYKYKLYDWLKENHISYKPNDKTKLKTNIDALLLGKYEEIALHIDIKPYNMSKKQHNDSMLLKQNRAEEIGLKLIFVHKDELENSDKMNELKYTLDHINKE